MHASTVHPSALTFKDNWRNGVMNLQLLDGSSWAAVPAGESTPLKIMSIDTGAGQVTFPGGVEIALVAEDSPTALCEDSCSFAADGQCDEPGVVRCSSWWCLELFEPITAILGSLVVRRSLPPLAGLFISNRHVCLFPTTSECFLRFFRLLGTSAIQSVCAASVDSPVTCCQPSLPCMHSGLWWFQLRRVVVQQLLLGHPELQPVRAWVGIRRRRQQLPRHERLQRHVSPLLYHPQQLSVHSCSWASLPLYKYLVP